MASTTYRNKITRSAGACTANQQRRNLQIVHAIRYGSVWCLGVFLLGRSASRWSRGHAAAISSPVVGCSKNANSGHRQLFGERLGAPYPPQLYSPAAHPPSSLVPIAGSAVPLSRQLIGQAALTFRFALVSLQNAYRREALAPLRSIGCRVLACDERVASDARAVSELPRRISPVRYSIAALSVCVYRVPMGDRSTVL